MIDAVVDTGATAWPLALTMACAVAVDRRRERRRRVVLNRLLHELRRPLQVIALGRDGESRTGTSNCAGQLDAALAALADLDAAVNRRPATASARLVSGRRLVAEAAERWRSPAALAGRSVVWSWRAGEASVRVDPAVAGRALDNLIANALEHGAERVRLTATRRPGRLRITVANAAREAPGPNGSIPALPNGYAGEPRSAVGDPRRGHGLAIVSGIATAAGGRFALDRGRAGAVAVLELPLAGR